MSSEIINNTPQKEKDMLQSSIQHTAKMILWQYHQLITNEELQYYIESRSKDLGIDSEQLFNRGYEKLHSESEEKD